MKRILAMITAILLVCTAVSAFAASNEKRYVISENGKSVNMRSEPEKKASVLQQLSVGTEVILLDTEGNWCKVEYSGQEGYILSSYLTSSKKEADGKITSTQTSAVQSKTAYITSSNGGAVYLRKEASKSSASMGTILYGEKVTVLQQGTTWSKVQYEGTMGYVMTQYITSEKPSPVATPTKAASSTVKGTVYIVSENGKNVRMRQGPGTGYRVLTGLSVGTEVEALSQSGSWTQIRHKGTNGYVMTQYVSKTKPKIEDSKATTDKAKTMYVVSENGKSVNVRASASSGSAVVGSLPVGTLVRASEMNDTWSSVQSGNVSGFMKTEYLSSHKPQATATPGKTEEPEMVRMYIQTDNGKSVNVRREPTKNSQAVGTLEYGTPVMSAPASANWAHVRTDSLDGYVMTQYLSSKKPAESSSDNDDNKPKIGSTVYIASKRDYAVRTRSGPGSSYSSVSSYVVGTPAKVLENVGDWTRIRVKGEEVYIPMSSIATNGKDALPNSQDRQIAYLSSSKGSVDLRKSKQNDSEILGSYVSGTAVILMSQNAKEGWAYIKVGNRNGYVDSKLLTTK